MGGFKVQQPQKLLINVESINCDLDFQISFLFRMICGMINILGYISAPPHFNKSDQLVKTDPNHPTNPLDLQYHSKHHHNTHSPPSSALQNPGTLIYHMHTTVNRKRRNKPGIGTPCFNLLLQT